MSHPLLECFQPPFGSPRAPGPNMAANHRQFVLGLLLQEVSPGGDHLPDRAVGHQPIRCTGDMMSGARPGILHGSPHHAGPHRIALHIANHRDQVPIRLDGKRVKPFLEEMATHTVAEVHVTGVAPMGFSDAAGEGVLPRWHHHDVDVVGHEAPGPTLQPVAGPKLPEQPQGLVAVRLGGEDGQGPNPALEDVMGQLGNDHTSQPRQALMLGWS